MKRAVSGEKGRKVRQKEEEREAGTERWIMRTDSRIFHHWNISHFT